MGKRINIEVDEEELQRNQQLRRTLSAIMAHPQGKILAQKAHKLVDPNAVTPELDASEAVNVPVQAIEKKFNDFVAKTEKEQADREEKARMDRLTSEWKAGQASLLAQKWTPDGIKKLEEFMEQKGIVDHEIAAAAFEKLHPPQTPVMPGGTGAWNFLELPTDDTGEYVKKLIDSKGKNNIAVDNAAHAALNEVRGQPRR